MNNIKSEIKLTEEQKKCAEYSLDQKILVINADPGTGKTEVLKHRTLFIHNHLIKLKETDNQPQRKLILVLAYGRNIATEIRTKLRTHQLKIYRRLKDILSSLNHQHVCSLSSCPTYLENQQPLILVCTIHSLASGINDLVIKEQFREERKIHVLVTTQRVEKKQGLISHNEQNQKFSWKSLGAIKSRKKKLFNYLFRRIDNKYWKEINWEGLWKIFAQSEPENVILTKDDDPFCHYEIDYSRFLSQVSLLLSDKSELLTKLEVICEQDKLKNVWLEFEDLITNANNLAKQLSQKTWPEFNYILVDECQDLKVETFHLITQVYGNEKTNFTFVGDPKQNIYGFAGAQTDIFKLIESKFPYQSHNIIATSFRLTPEIADFANHFIKKNMSYRASIRTTKPKTGRKPQIIIIGQEQDYQLSPHEMELIEQELKIVPTKKLADLVKNKIRQKKLHRHLDIILPLINQLDKTSSKAILYRQNWIGNLLQEWLNEKCVMTSTGKKVIDDIIWKVRCRFKNLTTDMKENSANQKNKQHTKQFFSLTSLLASCRISKSSIFELGEIVKKLDENSLPDSPLMNEQIEDFISQLEEVKKHPSITLSTIHGMKGLESDYVFLIFCDKKVLPKKERFKNEWEEQEEKNLFFTAITRPKTGLYITTSSLEECSKFIDAVNLDLNLVELK